MTAAAICFLLLAFKGGPAIHGLLIVAAAAALVVEGLSELASRGSSS